ncbi:Uncharacterised protein [Vibrio cholerae]|nr:Uncharacterised protein [Vibrio cholerae]CSI40058.1 Uncharacterised protein [Vibrio cholerae]
MSNRLRKVEKSHVSRLPKRFSSSLVSVLIACWSALVLLAL